MSLFFLPFLHCFSSHYFLLSPSRLYIKFRHNSFLSSRSYSSFRHLSPFYTLYSTLLYIPSHFYTLPRSFPYPTMYSVTLLPSFYLCSTLFCTPPPFLHPSFTLSFVLDCDVPACDCLQSESYSTKGIDFLEVIFLISGLTSPHISFMFKVREIGRKIG